MELITFLGKLFGYTPEIANVISGELRSVSEARRRPKYNKNSRPAGRERTFGVDTHPKSIWGRGVRNYYKNCIYAIFWVFFAE